ncbi:hypothetical protein [Clostridium sp. 001]|uniref:5'-methylthioadenosine/S-adenosylhomocysteine nucleosidase family protein n=1 Tax=Clostridium sp. 001 TaxID=1970093 RepID=UPI001C2BF546|nr:hypothetical protein [Clostridium sp. 001]QXE17959.1 hypothetical protein B5S50_03345 [Clostridium sp. 001]
MVFIVTALHCEAKPFIERFDLKRDNSVNKFQVFKNEEIVLIVSKTGAINMASACAYIIAKFEADQYDTFINIGVCGSKDRTFQIGTSVLCNKIIDNITDKDFYPDMIFKHPFKEACLESFAKIVDQKDLEKIRGDIVDMEGAAFFQAVSIFMPPHRIYSLKIVSDYLDGTNVTGEKVTELICEKSDEICNWIQDIEHECAKPKDILDEKDMNYINEIVCNFNLSVSMQHQLKKLAKGYKVRNDNLILALDPFTQIYCKTKYERKMYFEKLVQQLELM